MMNFKSFVALVFGASLLSSPAFAQKSRRGEQEAAYQATKLGAVHSLRSIENGIVPDMKSKGADYIGAEFDGQIQRYRLKFLRGSSVIWIDVDGRNGAIIAKAGE
jgi:hypothetical protein